MWESITIFSVPTGGLVVNREDNNEVNRDNNVHANHLWQQPHPQSSS